MKNCGHSIDAHFPNVVVTLSISLFPIMAANTLVMDNRKQIASQLNYFQHQKSCTLRWRSFSDCGCYGVDIPFTYKRSQYVGYRSPRANHFPINLLTPKLLMLHWRSVSACCCYRVALCFAYKGCKSVYYEYQQPNHIPLKLLTCLKISDVPLTLILRMGLLLFRFLFRLYRLRILLLCITTSKSLSN
jgi:hypothetical protein